MVARNVVVPHIGRGQPLSPRLSRRENRSTEVKFVKGQETIEKERIARWERREKNQCGALQSWLDIARISLEGKLSKKDGKYGGKVKTLIWNGALYRIEMDFSDSSYRREKKEAGKESRLIRFLQFWCCFRRLFLRPKCALPEKINSGIGSCEGEGRRN